MTHYTVAIIIPDDVSDIEDFVDKQMAPFEEHAEFERYVCYSLQQAATDLANEIQRLELIIRRNEDGYDIEKCRAALLELRQTTPKQKFEQRRGNFETFDEQGQPLSTYNPHSKWDWYVIGGRWDGWINDCGAPGQREDNLATTDQAVARRKVPHAIITPDGRWHERGTMGWFAILLTENENWDEEALVLFARYPAHRVVIVDAHI